MEDAQNFACLVRITGPDPKGMKFKDRQFYEANPNGTTILSASGIICADEDMEVTVVTSATLVAPFRDVEQDPNSNQLIQGCKIDIYFENRTWKEAELVDIVSLDGLHSVAESLVGGIIETKRGINIGSVARLRIPNESDAVRQKVSRLKGRGSAALRKGDSITIVSSPFGLVSPYVFQNSVTTGIISNMVQFRHPTSGETNSNLPPAFFLTDARCLPGSEGGAVFDDSGHLIGMVAPALKRGKSFSINFGAIIPLDLFVTSLGLKIMDNAKSIANVNPKSVTLGVTRCLPAVVIVSIGSGWGSGVVVSKHGHVLTCAHVVKPFTRPSSDGRLELIPGTRMKIGFRDAAKGEFVCQASLLYCSKGAVDVALLKLDASFTTLYVRLPSEQKVPQIVEGQPCLAEGHAVFKPAHNMACSVTLGVVSRVVKHPRTQEPVIIQSCANVYAGHSGGLLANKRGEFIGLITSNSKLSSGELIPTINFSIPVNVLRPLIERCQEGADEANLISLCNIYENDDGQLASLWSLQLGSDPPSLPDELNEKSSAFAEFVKQFGSKL